MGTIPPPQAEIRSPGRRFINSYVSWVMEEAMTSRSAGGRCLESAASCCLSFSRQQRKELPKVYLRNRFGQVQNEPAMNWTRRSAMNRTRRSDRHQRRNDCRLKLQKTHWNMQVWMANTTRRI